MAEDKARVRLGGGGLGSRQDEKKLGAHRNAKEVALFFSPVLPCHSGGGSSQLRHFINSCYLTSGIVVGLLRPRSHCNQQQCHQ